ncbi:MAG: 16S rRNA (uracil(1498)-N(3))-methyltransferase [Spirochaetales bacterium]|nr:16S rRNA (uracil(1498)-N(3))-methyltransferase [Spirochaetales bacterium]
MNIVLFETLEARNILAPDDYRAGHIKKILKLKEGDSFKAGVVDVSTGVSTITRVGKKGIEFTYVEEKPAESLYPITLLVGMVRPISMRRILREAVSLGVGRLILVPTDTGEKSYVQAGLYTSGEYRSILLDGAMQSGQCRLPEVVFTASLDEEYPYEGVRIALDNIEGSISLDHVETDPEQGVTLAVGPERGFSDRERILLRERGFILATFGNRILRTETICSAAVRVLLSRLGFL